MEPLVDLPFQIESGTQCASSEGGQLRSTLESLDRPEYLIHNKLLPQLLVLGIRWSRIPPSLAYNNPISVPLNASRLLVGTLYIEILSRFGIWWCYIVEIRSVQSSKIAGVNYHGIFGDRGSYRNIHVRRTNRS